MAANSSVAVAIAGALAARGAAAGNNNNNNGSEHTAPSSNNSKGDAAAPLAAGPTPVATALQPGMSEVVDVTSNGAFSNWSKLWGTGKLSDVTLVVGTATDRVEFPVHRLVLGVHSATFAAQLMGGMAESKEARVVIDNSNHELFGLMLQFMYTGRVKVASDQAVELFNLCDYYQVDTLREACARIIVNGLTPDKVGALLTSARQPILIERIQRWIYSQADACLSSGSFLIQMPAEQLAQLLRSDELGASEISIWHAIMAWAKLRLASGPSTSGGSPDRRPTSSAIAGSTIDGIDRSELKAKLAPLLPMVRLPLMSVDDLINVVKPTELISADTLLEALSYHLVTEPSEKPRGAPAQRIGVEECVSRGGTPNTTSGGWGYSGPADAIQVRASKRVQLLAVGAHVPSGPSSFEISIWDGNKRLHYTSLRRETRDDSKDLVVGTAVRLALADGGYVMERDKTYTISVLQRGKNTPSVQGCTSRARGGPPSLVLSAMGNGQGSSSGVEWTFANNTPNVTGLGDNGTSDTRGQLPCFWYKVMMG